MMLPKDTSSFQLATVAVADAGINKATETQAKMEPKIGLLQRKFLLFVPLVVLMAAVTGFQALVFSTAAPKAEVRRHNSTRLKSNMAHNLLLETPMSSTPSASTGFPSDPSQVDSMFDKVPRGCPAESKSLIPAYQNATFLKTEADLIGNDSHFYPIPHFDQRDEQNHTHHGGVALFRNAFVEGEFSCIFDCQSVYFQGGCRAHLATKASLDIAKVDKAQRSQKGIVSLDTVVLIEQYWGHGFYHSMMEDLPRLAQVVEFLRTHPEAVVLAYPLLMKDDRHKKVFNRLLGLKQTTWVPYDPSKTYFIRNLLVPTATPCGDANPKAVGTIQNFFLEKAKTLLPSLEGTNENQPLILVQKRSKRGLTNHDELMKALKKRFASCCQVRVFSGQEPQEVAAALHYRATVLVGPHGAGLSNAIFMKPHAAALVEIHPAVGNGGVINYCHQRTARATGLETRMLPMNQTRVSWGKPYPVEDIGLVLDTVQQVMDVLGSKDNTASIRTNA